MRNKMNLKCQLMNVQIPKARFNADDPVSSKMKELAARLKNGEPVSVSSNGQLASGSGNGMQMPAGKLASTFQWYDNDPQLFDGEKAAMNQFFPNFKMTKLNDGRLAYAGKINPRGNAGGVYELLAVYDNNHPNSSVYGGSIKVYLVNPTLESLESELGTLPHVLRDSNHRLYLCTTAISDLDSISKNGRVTSCAKSLGFATKWLFVFESWLQGEISKDDIFAHVY